MDRALDQPRLDWRWLTDLRAEPDILGTAVHMTRRLLRILREEGSTAD
jgi:hypothetical protein